MKEVFLRPAANKGLGKDKAREVPFYAFLGFCLSLPRHLPHFKADAIISTYKKVFLDQSKSTNGRDPQYLPNLVFAPGVLPADCLDECPSPLVYRVVKKKQKVHVENGAEQADAASKKGRKKVKAKSQALPQSHEYISSYASVAGGSRITQVYLETSEDDVQVEEMHVEEPEHHCGSQRQDLDQHFEDTSPLYFDSEKIEGLTELQEWLRFRYGLFGDPVVLPMDKGDGDQDSDAPGELEANVLYGHKFFHPHLLTQDVLGLEWMLAAIRLHKERTISLLVPTEQPLEFEHKTLNVSLYVFFLSSLVNITGCDAFAREPYTEEAVDMLPASDLLALKEHFRFKPYLSAKDVKSLPVSGLGTSLIRISTNVPQTKLPHIHVAYLGSGTTRVLEIHLSSPSSTLGRFKTKQVMSDPFTVLEVVWKPDPDVVSRSNASLLGPYATTFSLEVTFPSGFVCGTDPSLLRIPSYEFSLRLNKERPRNLFRPQQHGAGTESDFSLLGFSEANAGASTAKAPINPPPALMSVYTHSPGPLTMLANEVGESD